MNKNIKPEKQCVILVHGLARTSRSMETIANRFIKNGYHVVNIDYASRKFNINYIAKNIIIPRMSKDCLELPKHLIGYSMGGVVLQYTMENFHIENIKTISLIATPNKGSLVADYFSQWSFAQWFMGKAILELKSSDDPIIPFMREKTIPALYIIGDRSMDIFSSFLIPGVDDGKVDLDSAGIKEENTFVVHRSHTFIVSDRRVINRLLVFIQNHH